MKVSKIYFLILVILALIPLLDLVPGGMFLSHDGEAHIARLAAFYHSLAEGNLIPRWGGNLNAGFGHPALMFIYPLPMYLGSIFHFLGFSFVDSIKLVFGLAFFSSGLTMYLWVKEMWGEEAGFVAGLLYMFAPYRFVDLYVRGAVGENLAFVFPPLVAYFILRLTKEKKWSYVAGGSLSIAGLIMSHNALSLMFLAFICGYMLLLILPLKQKLFTIYYLLFTIFLGFGLSAFFWIPSLFEGKYTLRDIVLLHGDFIYHFPKFSQLLSSPWGYGGSPTGFSLQIGLIQWLAIFTSIPVLFFLWRKKDKYFWLYGFLILLFMVTLFLILPLSLQVWQKITILQTFQFSWRFLSLAVFISALLAGGLIYVLPKRYQSILACFLLILAFWFNKDFWHARGYFVKSDNYFLNVYEGTTDTGESSPRWGIRGMEEIGKKEPIELISGTAQIQNIKRLSNLHLYRLKVSSNEAQFVENTLYFPGWEVFIDGKKTYVEFQDPNHRGLMTFFAPQGEHEVKVIFNETRLRVIADLISFASLIILSLVGGIIWVKGSKS